MSVEKIDKLKKITKADLPHKPAIEPNRDHFESLMRQRRVEVEGTVAEQKEQSKKTENSIFDEVGKLNQTIDRAAYTSPKDLAKEAEDVIAQIDTLRNKLETPDLEIKASTRTILNNKLNHIDENLKIALNNAGLEYIPPEKEVSLAKPVERFLGLLTHSQGQLETLAGDVQLMAESNKELSPAKMLLIQIKVSYIQQEVELFTSMLNKALESVKTLGNVQV